MPRPGGAFQGIGHRSRGDPNQWLLRVHGLERGDEQAIHAPLGGEGPVAGQVARVVREVFFGAELQRVDEDAQDDAVGALLGAVDQAQVPFVQRAHGGHEAEAVAAGALGARPGAHVLGRCDVVHCVPGPTLPSSRRSR